jgi:LemA protein
MDLLITVAVIAIIPIIVLVWGVSVYNGLVASRNRFKNGYSQIDVQLRRRYDLIPNLVETAKAFLAHERQTMEAVIAARNQAQAAAGTVARDPAQPGAMQGLVAAETALTGSLGRMFALAEAYPQLKADTTMRQLSEELTSTENKVAFARQAYNDMVMSYNTAREVFPANLVAGFAGFVPAEPFVVQETAVREAPRVSF